LSSYHLSSSQKNSLQMFINALNSLLREHEMTVEFSDGALYSETIGYLGQLEDNKDYVSISDGQEDIFVSEKTPKEF